MGEDEKQDTSAAVAAEAHRLWALVTFSNFHFSNFLTNKSTLAIQLREHPHLAPQTFSLPDQADEVLRVACTELSAEDVLILKPATLSRGQGIRVFAAKSLIQELSNLTYRPQQKCVLQKYIQRPLLYEGCKFDLRLYLLLVSVDPLEIYLYKDGWMRMATHPYSLQDLGDQFCHLTNVSVQKKALGGPGQSFMPLDCAWKVMQDAGLCVASVQQSIDGLLMESFELLARATREKYGDGSNQEGGFLVLGADVLVDTLGHPWLLELNHSPQTFTSEMQHALAVQSLELVIKRERRQGRQDVASALQREIETVKTLSGSMNCSACNINDLDSTTHSSDCAKRITTAYRLLVQP